MQNCLTIVRTVCYFSHVPFSSGSNEHTVLHSWNKLLQ